MSTNGFSLILTTFLVACQDKECEQKLEGEVQGCPRPDTLDASYQAPTWNRALGSILDDLPVQWEGTIVPLYDSEGNETDGEAYPFAISRGEFDSPYDESALRITEKSDEEGCSYNYALDSVYTFNSPSLFELDMEITTYLYPAEDRLRWSGYDSFAIGSQDGTGSLLEPFTFGDGSDDTFHQRNWEALVINSTEQQLTAGPVRSDVLLRYRVPVRPPLLPEDPDPDFATETLLIATFEVSAGN